MAFLENIITETRRRVAAAKELGYLTKLEKRAAAIASGRPPNMFFDALARRDRVNIIAEIKRASPSKGVINANVDVAKFSRAYQDGNAAAVSVLTEGEHFGGSIKDLTTVAVSTKLPILRKDFIVDEYQLVESLAAGAHAVLLIASALSADEFRSLLRSATDRGLEVVTEVHNEAELELVVTAGSRIIGVNNRDLRTLAVSLDTSRRLAGLKPSGAVMVSESGLATNDQIRELRDLGFDAFLIGETLMRSGDRTKLLQEMTKLDA